MRLTIIGTGKMAEAIIVGVMRDFEVEVVGRDPKKISSLMEKYPKIKESALLDSPVDIEDKTLIFAIKPHALESISIYLSGEAKAVISVMAGVTIETLKSKINAKSYIRSMPNLAASYQKSMTTLYGDIDFKDEALNICNSFGKSLWLGSEKEIDIATAIAGSGPAFLALVAEALADGGVKEGLKREDAKILVSGLFEGASALLENINPSTIKDEVMSPGGTTAAGYAKLEEKCVRSAFIDAIESAYAKARG